RLRLRLGAADDAARLAAAQVVGPGDRLCCAESEPRQTGRARGSSRRRRGRCSRAQAAGNRRHAAASAPGQAVRQAAAEGPVRQLHAAGTGTACRSARSEEHTSELQSRENLVCRLLLEKKKWSNAA